MGQYHLNIRTSPSIQYLICLYLPTEQLKSMERMLWLFLTRQLFFVNIKSCNAVFFKRYSMLYLDSRNYVIHFKYCLFTAHYKDLGVSKQRPLHFSRVHYLGVRLVLYVRRLVEQIWCAFLETPDLNLFRMQAMVSLASANRRRK